MVKNEFRQILHPNAVLPLKIDGVNVPMQKRVTLHAFLTTYLIICLVISFTMIAMGIDNTNAITKMCIRDSPTPLESEYDTFACGHASNSISAALGMAVAARENGDTDRHVVAVIGDGAMSGGLAFEGLNNVSSTPNDMLIILNDNDMSIDRAVGGMEKYLLNLDTNEMCIRDSP